MDAAMPPTRLPAAPDHDTLQSMRDHMVDSQVRPNKVSDPRILAAMRALPRERFLPADRAQFAYLDAPVPLGHAAAGGRAMLEPMAIARLVQLAAPLAGERTLVVGAGTGYGAALLAACGAEVIALEEDPALIAIAQFALAEIALTQIPRLAGPATPPPRPVTGPLRNGWPAEAPYDLIFIEGAVTAIPPTLAAQLRPIAGRLVAVLAEPGTPPHAVVAERTTAGLHPQPHFDCPAPLLGPLREPPGFVF